MSERFYKLNKDLKEVLNKILKAGNGDIAVSKEDGDRQDVEKLIALHYLDFINDQSSFDEWKYTVRLTYNGLHYDELEKEYNKQVVGEWVKFWIPVSLSVITLVISVII